jgi:hypothetical protein
MGRRPIQTQPVLLDVPRFEQPDDVTCGPTCLAKVYQYYGFARPLDAIIAETPRNPDGGTLAVNLGISALAHGFRPIVYPFGMRIFDPTWHSLGRADLLEKLQRRAEVVDNRRLERAVRAFAAYLERGGRVRLVPPSADLLVRILRLGDPILTGLSATYLYGSPRELDNRYDDIGGHSAGHFVVVCGYRPRTRRFVVADPFRNVPLSRTGRYTVEAGRLITAILLGDQTYDAVLLTLGKRSARS